MTMSEGASVPICSYCGAKLVFRGQTSCQACGKDLIGQLPPPISESPPPGWPTSALAPASAPEPSPERAPTAATQTTPPPWAPTPSDWTEQQRPTTWAMQPPPGWASAPQLDHEQPWLYGPSQHPYGGWQPLSPPGPAAHRSRRSGRPMVLVAAFLVAALGAVGVAVAVAIPSSRPVPAVTPWTATNAPTPYTHVIHGTFDIYEVQTVYPEIYVWSDGTCTGVDVWADFKPGLDVVLTDGSGAVLATSSLMGGTGTALRCSFDFILTNVPDTADSYVVEAGGHGKVRFSYTDMVSRDWEIALELG